MDIRQKIFEIRGYTPIPFVLLMLVYAKPTLLSIVIGLALAVIGEMIRFWGVSIAGTETRTTGPVGATNLITDGPFAYVRNPLYVGNMLMYVGVGVMSNALWPYLVMLAYGFFLLQYTMIVTKEEEYLHGAFGDEYERYVQNVPRFLPRLRPYVGHHSFHRDPDLSRGFGSERRTLQAFAALTVTIIVIYLFRAS